VLRAGNLSKKIPVAIVLKVGKYVTVNFCGHSGRPITVNFVNFGGDCAQGRKFVKENFCGHCAQGWKTGGAVTGTGAQ
jgi:hypothetical protein